MRRVYKKYLLKLVHFKNGEKEQKRLKNTTLSDNNINNNKNEIDTVLVKKVSSIRYLDGEDNVRIVVFVIHLFV